jgi:DNA-directed RNA polymerase specialized sigma24 family protein
MFGEYGFVPPEEHYQKEVAKEDERNETIGKAIQSLKDPYATALRLRYFRRMTSQEIADEMSGQESSVNSSSSAMAAVIRGLSMLQKDLDPKIFTYLKNVTRANHKSAVFQDKLNKLHTKNLEAKRNKKPLK